MLASIATGAGLQGAKDFLHSEGGVHEVRAELASVRDLGITSVPTFVFNGRYTITGAQDPETLRHALSSNDIVRLG